MLNGNGYCCVTIQTVHKDKSCKRWDLLENSKTQNVKLIFFDFIAFFCAFLILSEFRYTVCFLKLHVRFSELNPQGLIKSLNCKQQRKKYKANWNEKNCYNPRVLHEICQNDFQYNKVIEQFRQKGVLAKLYWDIGIVWM